MLVDSDATYHREHPARPASSAMALSLVLFFMVAWKSYDALMNPQFWAEDSIVFFKDQVSCWYPLVFRPYAGYFHAVPRLGAWIASAFSPTREPLVYNLLAVTLVSASIGFTLHRLSRHVPWVVLLAAFMLVPTSGEIWGSLTNVHWFMQFALAVMCFDRVHAVGRVAHWMRCMIVFAMALSGPFSIFILLIVVFTLGACRIAAQPRWRPSIAAAANAVLASRDWPALAALALAAVIQAICVFANPASVAPETAGTGAMYSVVHLALLTITQLGPVHSFTENLLPPKAWIVFDLLMVGAICFGRLSREYKVMLLSLLTMAVLECTSASRIKPIDLLMNFGPGDRYFYIFKVLFWITLWSAGAGLVKRRQQRDVTAAVLIAMALVVAANPHLMRRSALPNLDWNAHATALKIPGDHVIPVNPQPWTITVSTDATGKMK
jgi:hypothetical protein